MAEPDRPLCRAAQAGLLLLPLAACTTVGPEHAAPPLPPAAQVAIYRAAPAAGPAGTADAATLAQFWRRFDDPVLERLVQEALARNLDVAIASARLQETQAGLGLARAERLPILGVDGLVTRSVTPAWQQPGRSRSERTGNVYTASGLMNWELDLFGRQRRGIEAAEALVQADEMGVAAAQAAVAAAVAREYFALRSNEERSRVAGQALQNQRQSLRLAQARQAAGSGTELDVARARNLVAVTAAGLPPLRAQIERSVQRLATLSGQPAAALAAQIAPASAEPASSLPALEATDLARLPIGTPEALLRQRPDIRAAERQLAAASAAIGIAMAARYPSIGLSGLLGLSSDRAGGFGASGSRVHTLGATLAWTAFDFGRTDASVSGAQARHLQAQLAWQRTVLNALEEVETALDGYTRTAEQLAELEVAASNADTAARIARARYAAGGSDLLVVLDAERQQLSARDQWVAARAALATSLVDVYRALGGGWPGPGEGPPAR